MILPDLSLLLTFVCAAVAIFWLWTKTRQTYENIPPYPVRPWPFFGHFFIMRGNLRDKMKAWRKQAGDVYSLNLAGQFQIFVNDYQLIKEIWVKNADRIINAQNTFGNEILGEHNKGIVGARGDNWKEQRTTSLSILRSFRTGKNLMAEKIEEEVLCTIEKLAAFKGHKEDVRLLFNVSISNVICSVVVGKRFEYDDPYFHQFIDQLRDTMKYLRTLSILTPFKYLYYLPRDLFHAKKWAKAALYINESFSKAHIRGLKNSFKDTDEPQNFITAYVKEMKKVHDKGIKSNLSEENLIAIIRLLLIAGAETTSTTILWCFLYMLHYPHVQEKVYKEIEANVGTARTPSMADKPKLTYLNAVIMETQRMASLVPTGVLREVSDTFEAGGFTFPKGSILWSVLDSVLHEKKIWGDPENFRPERFIDRNGALLKREEFIPFGIGRRICLGEALAKMELFLFLSAIFRRFKMEPVDKSGELPTLKEIYGTTLVPQPFTIRFIERKELATGTE